MHQLVCVACSASFTVADDDPLWSTTTDRAGNVLGRHIEAPCPECGAVSAERAGDPPAELAGHPALAVLDGGSWQALNRIEAAGSAPAAAWPSESAPAPEAAVQPAEQP